MPTGGRTCGGWGRRQWHIKRAVACEGGPRWPRARVLAKAPGVNDWLHSVVPTDTWFLYWFISVCNSCWHRSRNERRLFVHRSSLLFTLYMFWWFSESSAWSLASVVFLLSCENLFFPIFFLKNSCHERTHLTLYLNEVEHAMRVG